MKPQDLRIGSLVLDSYGQQRKILQLFSDSYQGENKDGDRNCYMYSTSTGIPLTEQWLKKAGFEEVYDHTCRWHELGIGDLVFYQGDKNGYVEVVLDGFENVRVRYVHSLQNLFWCLTGEELKIV